MPPGKKRRFVIAPFKTEKRREIAEKVPVYAEAKRMARSMMEIRSGGVGLPEYLETLGLARRRSNGLLLDITNIGKKMGEPGVGEIAGIMFAFYRAQDPVRGRKAHIEALRIVRQLKSLGFEVQVQDSRERGRDTFVRASQKAGARKGKGYSNTLPIDLGLGSSWARDQWINIDGRKEKPRFRIEEVLQGKSTFFGEGGSFVQVGPKEFVMIEGINDPRIQNYKRKGYTFHKMPAGPVYDAILSDLFGTRVYTNAPHIDFMIGGIPEKKIVAVDPNYKREHGHEVKMMRKQLGLNLITVPEEEAHRHPQNFLPLGNGRVLVDSGAPKFIERLKEAGIDVVPTEVPLNETLTNKGGLRCLFNEELID